MNKLLRFFLAALIGLFVGMFVQPDIIIVTVGVMIACAFDWDLEFAVGCIVAGSVVLVVGG